MQAPTSPPDLGLHLSSLFLLFFFPFFPSLFFSLLYLFPSFLFFIFSLYLFLLFFSPFPPFFPFPPLFSFSPGRAFLILFLSFSSFSLEAPPSSFPSIWSSYPRSGCLPRRRATSSCRPPLPFKPSLVRFFVPNDLGHVALPSPCLGLGCPHHAAPALPGPPPSSAPLGPSAAAGPSVASAATLTPGCQPCSLGCRMPRRRRSTALPRRHTMLPLNSAVAPPPRRRLAPPPPLCWQPPPPGQPRPTSSSFAIGTPSM